MPGRESSAPSVRCRAAASSRSRRRRLLRCDPRGSAVADDAAQAAPGLPVVAIDYRCPGCHRIVHRRCLEHGTSGRPRTDERGLRFDFDLVCIGSGPAGQRAAVQTAKLGKRAAVIEKRRNVGGICLDTGTIPSKTLREAVIATRASPARATACPGPGSTRAPPAQQLLAGVDHVISREVEVIEHQLRRNDVAVLAGQAPSSIPTRSRSGPRRARGASPPPTW